jgi:hypothetical protein
MSTPNENPGDRRIVAIPEREWGADLEPEPVTPSPPPPPAAHHPIVAPGPMYTTERMYRLNAIRGCGQGFFTRIDLEKAYDLGWEDGHPSTAKALDEVRAE